MIIAATFVAAAPALISKPEKVFAPIILCATMMICFVALMQICIDEWRDDNKYGNKHDDTIMFIILDVAMFLLTQVPVWIYIYSI